MSQMSLEWSSPAGPAALALLAGPWSRRETADAGEVFRVRVPGDGPAPLAADPLPTLASASARLRAALQPRGPGEALPRAEAELLRALTGEALVATAAAPAEVGPWLAELARRGTGPARVESTLGAQRCMVTEISATGQLTTHVLAGGPAEVAALHRPAVAAALRTRVTLLRTALATTELAALITAVASPAAVAIALPIAWRFLHTLLTERLAPSGGE